ncbi:2Fe-2S iron-sulfur cluster-binding protein [Thiohalomonas denitrificans]|uniref:2Fe-2S iron-sulfur cluster-binding protein n=1 Tax=Thiohalomonas denitrificans TaxID=415747 RepID=UPI0026E9AFA5|nr:2Fe-2S iron-sulfur cluster-binding protein [Thiohalomonas denitrificans]
MTLASLTGFIVLAIAAQTALWAGIVLLRHRREYASLRTRVRGNSVASSAAGSTKKPSGWDGFRPFRVERKVYEDKAHTICSFYLVPGDGAPLPPFQPGQYLTLQLEVIGPEDGEPRPVTRCYSLSDRPRPEYYRVTVKRVPAPAGCTDVPPGRISSHLHDGVQEGDQILVKAPSGPFHLRDRGLSPLALAGGGIGITPMLSMVETLLHEGSKREIWLFYGVRDGAEQVMTQRLEELAANHPNLHLLVSYSRPGEQDIAGPYRRHGRVGIDLLRITLPRQVETFYVCGPPALMESLVPDLEAWGIPPDQIHYETFGPASVKRRQRPAVTAPGEPFTVTFANSGKHLAWDPNAGSLLEFAEANGIEVNSGCRSGACGGCQTAVKEGDLDYLQPPEADVEPGTCLLCISTPKGDLTLSA